MNVDDMRERRVYQIADQMYLLAKNRSSASFKEYIRLNNLIKNLGYMLVSLKPIKIRRK